MSGGHRRVACGITAVVFAALALAAPLVAVALGRGTGNAPDAPEGGIEANMTAVDRFGSALRVVDAAVGLAGLSATAGVVAGVAALARGERRWPAIAGLAACVGALMLLAFGLLT
jgi:hypothetical protein